MTQTIIYLSVKHLLKTTTTCPQYLPQLDKIPDTPSKYNHQIFFFPLKTQITKYIEKHSHKPQTVPKHKPQQKKHNQYTNNQNLTKTITSRKAVTITPPKIKNSTHQITTQNDNTTSTKCFKQANRHDFKSVQKLSQYDQVVQNKHNNLKTTNNYLDNPKSITNTEADTSNPILKPPKRTSKKQHLNNYNFRL